MELINVKLIVKANENKLQKIQLQTEDNKMPTTLPSIPHLYLLARIHLKESMQRFVNIHKKIRQRTS